MPGHRLDSGSQSPNTPGLPSPACMSPCTGPVVALWKAAPPEPTCQSGRGPNPWKLLETCRACAGWRPWQTLHFTCNHSAEQALGRQRGGRVLLGPQTFPPDGHLQMLPRRPSRNKATQHSSCPPDRAGSCQQCSGHYSPSRAVVPEPRLLCRQHSGLGAAIAGAAL